MSHDTFTIGEVRKAPNGNRYAFICMKRTNDRVALLLIHTRNIQSTDPKIMSLALDAWRRYEKIEGMNESTRITTEVQRNAHQLLHEPPDPRYKK